MSDDDDNEWGPLILILLGLAAVVGILSLAVQYWQISIPIIILAAIIIYIVNQQKEERAHQASQVALRLSLVQCVKDSQQCSMSIAARITEVDKLLDQAQHDYGDGLFAPFWDSIESAANLLIQAECDVRKIKDHTLTFKSNIGQIEADPPSFSIDIEKLPNLTVVAEKMRTIVRKAQSNFQFATIYEQRKTNRILGEGFSNLGEALREMGNRIDNSLTDLANTFSSLIEVTQTASHDRREYEKKTIGILDDIRQHRKQQM